MLMLTMLPIVTIIAITGIIINTMRIIITIAIIAMKEDTKEDIIEGLSEQV